MWCGIFPDQESNLCLLHWQADSLPLSHARALYFLFLCQFHIALITVASSVVWNQRACVLQLYFFFFKIVLAIQGPLCFHTNCKIFCTDSVKNAIGNILALVMIEVALNLCINCSFSSTSKEQTTWQKSGQMNSINSLKKKKKKKTCRWIPGTCKDAQHC